MLHCCRIALLLLAAAHASSACPDTCYGQTCTAILAEGSSCELLEQFGCDCSDCDCGHGEVASGEEASGDMSSGSGFGDSGSDSVDTGSGCGHEGSGSGHEGSGSGDESSGSGDEGCGSGGGSATPPPQAPSPPPPVSPPPPSALTVVAYFILSEDVASLSADDQLDISLAFATAVGLSANEMSYTFVSASTAATITLYFASADDASAATSQLAALDVSSFLSQLGFTYEGGYAVSSCVNGLCTSATDDGGGGGGGGLPIWAILIIVFGTLGLLLVVAFCVYRARRGEDLPCGLGAGAAVGRGARLLWR